MQNDELKLLELQLAFGTWAAPRGYDLTRNADDSGYALLETQAAWLGFEAAHGPDGCKPKGQQLYAQVKKSSEYAHQTDGIFPVRVGQAPYGDYVVHGGPGGVYRLRDVNIYVIQGGQKYRLG
jgi:hypothetical protein